MITADLIYNISIWLRWSHGGDSALCKPQALARHGGKRGEGNERRGRLGRWVARGPEVHERDDSGGQLSRNAERGPPRNQMALGPDRFPPVPIILRTGDFLFRAFGRTKRSLRRQAASGVCTITALSDFDSVAQGTERFSAIDHCGNGAALTGLRHCLPRDCYPK